MGGTVADKTQIEWTDATWNPVRGCSRVSEGCRHCYAERVAARFSGPGLPYEGLAQMRGGEPRWTGEVRLIEKHLRDPLKWREPRRIFVNSMSDLFHEKLEWEAIDRVFGVMAWCGRHVFQVLTKRPGRMRDYCTSMADLSPQDRALRMVRSSGINFTVRPEDNGGLQWPLPNVWLGVSAEDQVTANERVPELLATPAAVRFVSAEPLLGRIDFTRPPPAGRIGVAWDWLRPGLTQDSRLDWVIVGGESGLGARPMHPTWARSLRDQCVRAGVAFFFKQWGEWSPVAPQYPKTDAEQEDFDSMDPLGDWLALELTGFAPLGRDHCDYQPGLGAWLMERAGKKQSGRELDGRTWDEFPSRTYSPTA